MLKIVGASLLVFLFYTSLQAAEPILCFTDLDSGPKSGNSDTSLGQITGEDGAIVTVWGKNLGGSQAALKVVANGAESRVYYWSNASAPADLFTRHQMQMVSFQVSHRAKDSPGEIYIEVNGRKSNPLPFTVRAGKIFFVKATGNNAAAGDWAKPWKSIPQAVNKMAPGDITYICDGVSQVTEDGYNAAVNLGSDGEPGRPKALIVYPGAMSAVGTTRIQRGFGHWVSGKGHTADYWILSKFSVTAGTSPIIMGSGYRVVGNYVTAPTGSAPEGAIEGEGNNLFILGNEITRG